LSNHLPHSTICHSPFAIPHLLPLDRAYVSENLVEEALRNPRTKVAGPPVEMIFDVEENLM